VENDPTQTRVRLRFRECRVVPSKGSKVDKLLYPDSKSWTESLQELLGRLDEKGWALLDPQGEDGKARDAFVVEVLR
jgi:hypothetical protein